MESEVLRLLEQRNSTSVKLSVDARSVAEHYKDHVKVHRNIVSAQVEQVNAVSETVLKMPEVAKKGRYVLTNNGRVSYYKPLDPATRPFRHQGTHKNALERTRTDKTCSISTLEIRNNKNFGSKNDASKAALFRLDSTIDGKRVILQIYTYP